eukprot:TRINITY_DN58469_c0_g1_i1.p1 TRINITY_DN58469_c0_g1~~TRINITY_DN58469_c0_g1_i1.p1  ORF type:complete len:139 (-),score=26.22 TRINITY_DN58469_c0_g1_i1:242-598(-)
MALRQQHEVDERCTNAGSTTLPAATKHDRYDGAAETRHSVLMQALVKAAAGTTAEVVTTFMFYPLELIRDRLAATRRDDGFNYSSTLDGLVSVAQEEDVPLDHLVTQWCCLFVYWAAG